MNQNKDRIETHGNRCFVGRPINIEAPTKVKVKAPVHEKKKTEKMVFSFGKIKVQVISAQNVKVRQDGDALVLEVKPNANIGI